MTKTIKRPIAFLSAVVMFMVMLLYFPSGTFSNIDFGLTASAEDTITPTEPSQDESGVYQIGTKEELYWFADYVYLGNSSANAVLTQDIIVNTGVLTESGELNTGDFTSWTPIGNFLAVYTGTFDGQNHTISGLYCDYTDSSTHLVGLFGVVGVNGKVLNVGVVDSYFNLVNNSTDIPDNIYEYMYIGGVCGGNIGGTIEGCYSRGTVKATGYVYVGGVCGGNNQGKIKDCHNEGTVSGNDNVGGVCGINYDGTIENGSNTGSVSGSTYVGGVCGWNYADTGTATIENSHNTGSVSGSTYVGGVCGFNYSYSGTATATIKNSYNTGSVTANDNNASVGGVCGSNSSYSGTATIENSHNTGSVTAGGSYASVGGVCGSNSSYSGTATATIKNSHNTGSVTADGSHVNIGGVCGSNSGTIESSYNSGTVSYSSNSNSDSNGSVYVGGVCGINRGTIESSYNSGTVSYSSNSNSDSNGSVYVYVGGVCGYNINLSSTIKNSYNIGKVSYSSNSNSDSNIGIYGYVYVGGVCGYNEGTIKNSYNSGTVSYSSNSDSESSVHVGGVCGYNYGDTIENGYFNSDVYTGSAVGYNLDGTVTAVEGKTTEQFNCGEVAYLLQSGQTEDDNGNIPEVWGQDLITDNSYPVLDSTKKVYQNVTYTGCEGNPGEPTYSYSNTAEKPKYKEHTYNENGLCTICQKSMSTYLPIVKTVSATLAGDIGLNYYISLPESVTADTGAYVQFTVNGQDTQVFVKDLTAENDTYKCTCWLTAKQMRDNVTFKLYDGNNTLVDIYKSSGDKFEGASFDYSLKTYLDTLSSDEDETLSNIANATLTYGAYAQKVFNYNAEDLTLDSSELADVTVDTLETNKMIKTGDIPDGLNLTEMTLILKSETTLRLYFKSDNIQDYTFTLDDVNVTLNEITGEGLYYIEIANISAKDLDTMHTLKINDDCTLTFNALSYAYVIVKSGTDENLCNVVKALYKYNVAANAYFDN